jgi:hypothetical protein
MLVERRNGVGGIESGINFTPAIHRGNTFFKTREREEGDLLRGI